MNKIKVAFVCVHNSCRSQMAEALGRKLAGDVFESYSAGTETKPNINPHAVRIMKQIYTIDMEKTQHPKLISDIPGRMSLLQWGVMLTARTCPVSTGRIGAWKIRQGKAIMSLSLLQGK